jgi:anion-transporting  ArsA/GET3 family ATPase
MPASGHSVSMLRIPWVIVDTVPEGPLTRDARTVKELLCDPARTAAVLVTLAEEMPVNEACELEQKLTDLGIAPQHVICNQIYPDHFPAGSPIARVVDALAADPALSSPLAEVAGHAMLSRDRHALNARYLAELRARARAPVTELPMVFAPTLAPADVRTLGELLARGAHRE